MEMEMEMEMEIENEDTNPIETKNFFNQIENEGTNPTSWLSSIIFQLKDSFDYTKTYYDIFKNVLDEPAYISNRKVSPASGSVQDQDRDTNLGTFKAPSAGDGSLGIFGA